MATEKQEESGENEKIGGEEETITKRQRVVEIKRGEFTFKFRIIETENNESERKENVAREIIEKLLSRVGGEILVKNLLIETIRETVRRVENEREKTRKEIEIQEKSKEKRFKSKRKLRKDSDSDIKSDGESNIDSDMCCL